MKVKGVVKQVTIVRASTKVGNREYKRIRVEPVGEELPIAKVSLYVDLTNNEFDLDDELSVSIEPSSERLSARE